VIRIGVVAATAIVVTATSGGAANAAVALPYQSQALHAGLSVAQAKDLQVKVNGYIAEFGGTQVSANEVVFPGGRVTVALPGEKTARSLLTDYPPCWAGSFCVFEYMYFSGDVASQWDCSKYVHVPSAWSGNAGSWRNNQSTNTAALLYDWGWNLNYISWAYEQQEGWNLGQLGHVDPC
jgi:hypothetical protein